MSRQGVVFDIQRYSLADGPGIRTTVFLKGCPLGCAWCANPESQSVAPEVGWFEEQCLHCGRCAENCKHGAICMEDGGVCIDHARCVACGDCLQDCAGGALKLFGRTMCAEDVMRIVERDRDYYALSDGGMTLSGGDIVCQAVFGAELLRLARAMHINTAIETSAFMPVEKFLPLARLADRVYVDFKIADSQLHRQWTGCENAWIRENICAMRAEGLPLTVRTPLIPGVNTSNERVREAARFLKEARIGEVELLPYHCLGLSKYAALGRTYCLRGLPQMSAEEAGGLARIYEEYGISARVVL